MKQRVPDDDPVMPAPPFPSREAGSPGDRMLQHIVEMGMQVHDETGDPRAAILHAAVHAWYEGHVEGEDSCPGCSFRGDQEWGVEHDYRSPQRFQVPPLPDQHS